MISRSERLAVGQMGFKSPPDASGAVELGYGVNASCRNRGYATEMAQALTAWALKHPSVRRVLAECAEGNRGSIRVLEKAGFRPVGRRLDPEEGTLLLWAQGR
jgi:RimJ/RimL family protein N-acetyltransferase